ncbi:matrix metalloproteinase-15-like [Branchiostoma floridae]|uniref:Matrix metalloproteinase-15-like n=1 Tax=Branchiostoma floridae TaxID=7739 RepID=A0A9J7MIR1_BRAFL|nr:matrix metalloproteinase-15-like [Branchiostoma floridae]
MRGPIRMNTYMFLAVFASTVLGCSSALGNMTVQQGMNYLVKFGYMDHPTTLPVQLQSEESMSQAISMFQEFANIPVTGKLDNETMVMMEMPRCGVPDMMGTNSSGLVRRRRRYVTQDSKWRKRQLKWKLNDDYKNLGSMGMEDVEGEIDRAFRLWHEHIPLNFTRVTTGKADIDIRFYSGDHGDGDPFDGPFGTLAHAYFPIYGGDVHFDKSETWTFRTYRGTNLFQVAAHEIGHSLGLRHSQERNALMAAFYRGYVPNLKLHSDDIAGIQSLYDRPRRPTPRPRPPPPGIVTPRPRPPAGLATPRPDAVSPSPTPDRPDSCSGELDAITIAEDSKTYAFKGNYFWELNPDGIVEGYPKLISEVWGDLPGDLDAAVYNRSDQKLYFFKGDQYWRYTNTQQDIGYPRNISQWGGVPNDIDAAFIWSGNGRLYFFKGDQYYRYNRKGTGVDMGYPRAVSVWKGIPADGLDAAMQWLNGKTYFFKDGLYWRFNDRTFRMDRVDPSYPRSTAYWWFGCENNAALKLPPSELQDANSGINVVPTVFLPSLSSVLMAKLVIF